MSGATQQRPMQAPKPKTMFMRDFSAGVNVGTAREAIEDNQAWWMEGMIPLAPGNLQITDGPAFGDSGDWHTLVAGETGAPSFLFSFNIAGTDYVFVVWKNSGNGYIGPTIGFGAAKKFNGTLTSGQTSAAQWNNQGILIVDPAGYWDWNVTAAATLTALNNSVQSITITDPGSGATGPGIVTITGGGGSSATAGAYCGVGSAIPAAVGSGYKVGDVLTFFYTLGLAPGGVSPQLTVTTVNATGGVTGLSVTNAGQGVNIGANPTAGVALLGGAGTGATANLLWGISLVIVTNRGNGYTSAPAIALTLTGAARTPTATATVSGSLAGVSIAAYAGRAWIANSRTVTFTDAGSYASFVGSGSQFTINDDYLHNTITALYAANNYLYIFGDTSIDVLSNVTVTSAGTASFSRVNVSASIGTSQPYSIFAYYRSIAFANQNGFYLLSGATPEKISDAINLVVQNTDFSLAYLVSGAQVTVCGELCAAWSVTFRDNFVNTDIAATSHMLVLYFKGKWFFARPATTAGGALKIGPITSVPISGKSYLYTFDGAVTPQFYILFSDTTQTFWRLLTKIYDCGSPITSKQATRGAMIVQMGGVQPTRNGLVLTVDDETHNQGAQVSLETGTFTGYKRFIGGNAQGGGLYMGMGAYGVSASQADVTRIQALAFLYTEMTEWPA